MNCQTCIHQIVRNTTPNERKCYSAFAECVNMQLLDNMFAAITLEDDHNSQYCQLPLWPTG